LCTLLCGRCRSLVFTVPVTTMIFILSLHDALPVYVPRVADDVGVDRVDLLLHGRGGGQLRERRLDGAANVVVDDELLGDEVPVPGADVVPRAVRARMQEPRDLGPPGHARFAFDRGDVPRLVPIRREVAARLLG